MVLPSTCLRSTPPAVTSATSLESGQITGKTQRWKVSRIRLRSWRVASETRLAASTPAAWRKKGIKRSGRRSFMASASVALGAASQSRRRPASSCSRLSAGLRFRWISTFLPCFCASTAWRLRYRMMGPVRPKWAKRISPWRSRVALPSATTVALTLRSSRSASSLTPATLRGTSAGKGSTTWWPSARAMT
ncbi:hypothetical protein D3C86_961020 [compost metagenome]